MATNSPPRPFNEFLLKHRRGGLHGDLSEALQNVAAAVNEHGKAGKLTLSITIKPNNGSVMVHPTSGRVEAIFDDHHADGAGHGEHRAVLQLQPTPEWTRWKTLDRKLIKQQAFAEHLEDALEDVIDPPGADLLEIITTLEGKSEVNWRQGVRLNDGTVQFLFDETVDARAGQSGDLHIPQRFTLSLAPFYGEQRTDITARLRWRLNGGDLTVGYILDQPDELVQRTLNQVRGRLQAEFARTYVGTPR